MAFVKLKRSWFSCGTIFASQVSSILVFADHIQFSFVGATDTISISNHYRPIYGNEIVNSHFIACHMTVAAESSIQIFLPRLERAIPLVTRAFSFFLHFLGFCDVSWVFHFL